MRKVWRDIAHINPLESDNKLVTYHFWFACPLSQACKFKFDLSPLRGAPLMPPCYLHLDLPKHVMRNASRFRL